MNPSASPPEQMRTSDSPPQQLTDSDSADPSEPERQTRLDRLLAGPMFVFTSLFLAIAGTAIHLFPEDRYRGLAAVFGWILAWLMPVYIAEFAAHWWVDKKFPLQNLFVCLFPPLRLGTRDHIDGSTIWVPGYGWRDRGR